MRRCKIIRPETFEDRYLSGKYLYGDDFTQDEISDWFESEQEGYASLDETRTSGDEYSYHALNALNGFRHLPSGRRFTHALGVGSAYGAEFQPVSHLLDELTILEPSSKLVSDRIGLLRPKYVSPRSDGTMPFHGQSFDLVVCLGALHHIPNVSRVITEIGRVLAPGGYALIREPIVSMGDWRTYRGAGLTSLERGIPLPLLRNFLIDAGLSIKHETLSGFPITRRLGFLSRSESVYNSRLLTRIDMLASAVTRSRYRYHSTNKLQKLQPTSAYFVLVRN